MFWTDPRVAIVLVVGILLGLFAEATMQPFSLLLRRLGFRGFDGADGDTPTRLSIKSKGGNRGFWDGSMKVKKSRRGTPTRKAPLPPPAKQESDVELGLGVNPLLISESVAANERRTREREQEARRERAETAAKEEQIAKKREHAAKMVQRQRAAAAKKLKMKMETKRVSLPPPPVPPLPPSPALGVASGAGTVTTDGQAYSDGETDADGIELNSNPMITGRASTSSPRVSSSSTGRYSSSAALSIYISSGPGKLPKKQKQNQRGKK